MMLRSKIFSVLLLLTVCGSATADGASGAANTKKRNPLAVDRNTAVKQDAAHAVELPGVMKLDGANPRALDFSRAQEITVTNGGAQTVYISDSEANRIQLPFANPYVLNKDNISLKKRGNSNNIYVEYIGDRTNPEPSTLFIEPPEGGGYAITLELVPKGIPLQVILVKDDSYQTAAERKKKPPKSNSYVQRVQYLMEVVGLGGTPDGFVKTELDLPPIAMNGVMVEPAYRYSNSEFDLFQYVVTNISTNTIELTESEFDGENVKAVSIHPKPNLTPKERTTVYVLAGKLPGDDANER